MNLVNPIIGTTVEIKKNVNQMRVAKQALRVLCRFLCANVFNRFQEDQICRIMSKFTFNNFLEFGKKINQTLIKHVTLIKIKNI